jgi:hypothetical protein
MKLSACKVGVAGAIVLMAGGCIAPAMVEENRRDELRREFSSGQISNREYQQQLDQMERAKAEAAAAEKKK